MLTRSGDSTTQIRIALRAAESWSGCLRWRARAIALGVSVLLPRCDGSVESNPVLRNQVAEAGWEVDDRNAPDAPFDSAQESATDSTSESDAMDSGQSIRVRQCPYAGPDQDVAAREEFVGSNGVFLDECDENGNLVTSECVLEDVEECDDAGCSPRYRYSNVVRIVSRDCAGTCMDGRCESKCAVTGDVLEYVRRITARRHLVRNQTSGFAYLCEQYDDNPDCTPPPPGATTTVLYNDGSGQTCMGTEWFPVDYYSSTGSDCSFKCIAA